MLRSGSCFGPALIAQQTGHVEAGGKFIADCDLGISEGFN